MPQMYYITQRQLNDLDKTFEEARLSKMRWSDLGQAHRMWIDALVAQRFSKPKTIIINNLDELQAALMAGIVTGTPERPLGRTPREPGEPDDRDKVESPIYTVEAVKTMQNHAYEAGRRDGLEQGETYRHAYMELLSLVDSLKASRVDEVKRTSNESYDGKQAQTPTMTAWSLWTSKFGRRYPLMALPLSNLLRGRNIIERKYFDR